MPMIMIEGFEQIDPSIVMTASQFQYLLLASQPDVITGWFGGGGDAVQHTTNGRIDGNCLRMTRGSNAGAAWSRQYAANLGFSFIPKQKMCFGFAVRYSAAPLASIPLACFRFDRGFGEQEQISLWATADAKLYVSTTDYRADYDLLAVGINPLATTAAGAFRFTQWTYIELVVDYAGDTPTVSVAVNGEPVLNAIADDSFQKLVADPYISSAHIINPSNGHWGVNTFWQEIDDVYLHDTNALGPQWIAGLANGLVNSNVGWSGVPDTVYTTLGAGVEAAAFGNIIDWALADPPANVGAVNAIGVNVIASVLDSIDSFYFGVKGSGLPVYKGGSVSGGFPDRCLRMLTEVAPVGTTMTGTGLVSLKGYLEASRVVLG